MPFLAQPSTFIQPWHLHKDNIGLSYPYCVLADRNRSVIHKVVIKAVVSQHTQKRRHKEYTEQFSKYILAEKKESREGGQNVKP